MSKEFKNLLLMLGSDDEENFALGLTLLKNYSEEFKAHYGCDLKTGIKFIKFIKLLLNKEEEVEVKVGYKKWLPSQSFSVITGLNLGGLDLNQVPSYIFSLKNLENLDLSSNSLEYVPKGLEKMKELKKLNISRNDLAKFPNQVLELSNLEELDLSHNNIKIVPPSISQLKKLKKLTLSGNGLEKAPIFPLPQLEYLDISCNKMQYLPSMKNFINLRTLDISGNHLVNFPNDLDKSTLLERFYCSHNCFDSTNIPKWAQKRWQISYISNKQE